MQHLHTQLFYLHKIKMTRREQGLFSQLIHINYRIEVMGKNAPSF